MNQAEAAQLATLVCKPLFAAWGGAAGAQARPLPLNRELTRMGILARDAEVVAADAGEVVGMLRARHAYRDAAALGRQSIAVIDQAHAVPPFHLLRLSALSCQIVGDAEDAQQLLERALEVAGTQDTEERAQALAELGELLFSKGDVAKAEQYIRQAIGLFAKLRKENQEAVANGRLADILFRRGRLDEALAIRQEKELPVYERLGDVRSLAVTHGKVADILFARGRLDEALAIRQEKELPVYERLGDVRSLAVTHGDIADILFRWGRLDEALAIRQEKQLPVYERLGDVRELAVTHGQVADILFARGRLDEALAIRQEKELPVYERLGDVRSLAVTHGKVADILFRWGRLDEALAIRQEKELPVYERLGDVRSLAVAHGKVADILFARGRLDEALAIRQEKQLPVYERLGDVRELIVCRTNIGLTLLQRGRTEEIETALGHLFWALQTAREHGLPEAEQIAKLLGQLLPTAQEENQPPE